MFFFLLYICSVRKKYSIFSNLIRKTEKNFCDKFICVLKYRQNIYGLIL